MSAVFAAGAFYLDKKTDFFESLNYLYILLAGYTVVLVVQFLHAKFVEKSIIYQGVTKERKGSNQQQLEVSGTLVDKFTPVYKLTIKLNGKPLKTDLPFTKVFDEFGNLHESQLKVFLQDALSKIKN